MRDLRSISGRLKRVLLKRGWTQTSLEKWEKRKGKLRSPSMTLRFAGIFEGLLDRRKWTR